MTAIQDTYRDELAHCFGCGRLNEHGHQFKTFSEGEFAITTHRPDPVYTSAGEFAYGGLIASVIDCHSAGAAAIFWMQAHGLVIDRDPTPGFVTARLEVDYVAPTPLLTMRVIGSAAEIGERKVIVTSELSVDGTVTARGRGVMVRISPDT
jgi:acyl-coenzyme A thioesterase PaaI-like protein